MPTASTDVRRRPERRRLNTWEQIADYLGAIRGKTLTVKTAGRWETREGLPVHRDGSSVFAWTDELDQWHARRIAPPTAEAPLDSPATTQEQLTPRSAKQSSKKVVAGLVTATALVVLAMAITLAFRDRQDLRPISTPRWGRLLVQTTSENAAPTRIPLNDAARRLVITPDGTKIFASAHGSPVISVVYPSSGRVDRITLGSDVDSMVVSPDGTRLYAGSRVEGVTILDTTTYRTLSQIPIEGEVLDLAITPDGKKLFLAMIHKGLWRILTATGKLAQITGQPCPMYLQTGVGRKLFVSYQCGGPTGRSGHDAVEIYDTETETRLGTVSGPPMVGGPLAPSPDGSTLVMDGEDACASPQYDHQGCLVVPSRVIHFLRLSDHQIIKTLSLPLTMSMSAFIDQTHFLFVENHVGVMDALQYAETESWDFELPVKIKYQGVAVDPIRRKVYIGAFDRKEILVLDAESPGCSPVEHGLVSFYSADGVMNDRAGEAPLTPKGGVQYGPGRVGQAFVLDGKSGYLTGPETRYNPFGYRDSSFSAYVKFANLGGEMTVFDRTFPDTSIGARLMKALDRRIVFDFRTAGGEVHLVSKTVVVQDRWYQVAVTKNDHEVALYLNGVLEDTHALPSGQTDLNGLTAAPLSLGASYDRRRFLQGKLDEILLYGRALDAQEVQRLYQMRESGDCRL